GGNTGSPGRSGRCHQHVEARHRQSFLRSGPCPSPRTVGAGGGKGCRSPRSDRGFNRRSAQSRVSAATGPFLDQARQEVAGPTVMFELGVWELEGRGSHPSGVFWVRGIPSLDTMTGWRKTEIATEVPMTYFHISQLTNLNQDLTVRRANH